MMMRYHPGFGVGHTYAHDQASGGTSHSPREGSDDEEIDLQKEDHICRPDDNAGAKEHEGEGANEDEDEDAEVDSEDEEGGSSDNESDDEEFLAMDEMYGR